MTFHRGVHPEDQEQFSPSQLPMLRAAVRDLSWLRSRDYGDASSIEMVGDRYRLKRRQRDAVARSACSDAERVHRLVRRREPSSLVGRWIDIDGFNVLISVEGLLGGAYVFIGRDRAYRDVDPVQGTYRIVEETEPAIESVRDAMLELGVKGLTWWLNAHVSNVGPLKTRLAKLSPESIDWGICVRESVDDLLAEGERILATSDSEIFDHLASWCSIEQVVCANLSHGSNVCDLRPCRDGYWRTGLIR